MTGSFSKRTMVLVLLLLGMYVVFLLWLSPPIQSNLSRYTFVSISIPAFDHDVDVQVSTYIANGRSDTDTLLGISGSTELTLKDTVWSYWAKSDSFWRKNTTNILFAALLRQFCIFVGVDIVKFVEVSSQAYASTAWGWSKRYYLSRACPWIIKPLKHFWLRVPLRESFFISELQSSKCTVTVMVEYYVE